MAKKKKWGKIATQECTISMGPMIDCVFLLLLYFISVSTIDSVRTSQEVNLPIAEQGIIEKDKSGRFYVDVEWHESTYEAIYKIGTLTIYDTRDLTPMIEQSAKMCPRNFRVVIRADRRVPYEFTQEVMAAVAAANVPHMIFSTLEVELL